LENTPLGQAVPDIRVSNAPTFANPEERKEFIEIVPKHFNKTALYKKGFVEVNAYVPDYADEKGEQPNLERIQALQKLAWDALQEQFFVQADEDAWWVYTEGVPTVEKDAALRSHFVNTHVTYRLFIH
jgi:hypothetical protein